jgi:hypothetical protein
VVGLGHAGALVGAMPYADMQCMLDDPPGHRNYWSAEYLGGFPDAAVAAFCASAEAMIVPSPSQHAVFPQGGAIARGLTDYPRPALLYRSAQPFLQLRPAPTPRHIVYSYGNRLSLTDQHYQALSARHPGVEQVTLQHRVAGHDRDEGVLEHREDEKDPGHFGRRHLYRKTALFDRFLSFGVTLENAGGPRH